MAMRASDARARVEAAWAPFRRAVAHVDLEAATAAGWTGKEMLAHVAFWDEAVIPVVVTMFRGDKLPADWSFGSGDLGLEDGQWPLPDVHNAREAAWARGRSEAEVVERAERAHDRLVTLLGTVTDREVADHLDYFRVWASTTRSTWRSSAPHRPGGADRRSRRTPEAAMQLPP